MKKYLEIGKIVGTHGIKGEVRVQPWADSGEFLLGFRKFYDKNGAVCHQVTSARVHKNIVIAKITGIDSIEQADTLRGTVLYIDREDANLPEGRYFIQDLIGLRVVDADSGEEYGVVTDVFNTVANDVYSLRSPDGKEHFIPAIDSVLAGTDLDAGVIKIHAMKGMFDDDEN